MIKSVSTYDLQMFPQFKDMSEFDLIHPDNYDAVTNLLFQLGMDIKSNKFPPSVQACKHRTIKNQVVVGYRWIGLERTDVEWKPYASLESRIYSHKDLTLVSELLSMSREGSWGDERKCSKRCKSKPTEEDYKEVVEKIKQLQEKQFAIRGCLSGDEDILYDLNGTDERINPHLLYA